MKLFELLNDPVNFDDLIREKAPGFFRQTGGQFLYRTTDNHEERPVEFGVDADSPIIASYWEEAVRKDRRPMSTSASLSKVVDEFFEEAFAFRARSAAMFCFGTQRAAEGYNSPRRTTCMVVPVGKFSYVWSPNIDDLYNLLFERMDDLGDYSSEKGQYIWNREAIFSFMRGLKYSNNDLPKAIKSGHEIMVDCDSFLAFPVEQLDQPGFDIKDYI